MPCSLFTIFCTGGIDFVGGFVLYNFLKRPLFNPSADLTQQLGNLDLDKSHGFKSGE